MAPFYVKCIKLVFVIMVTSTIVTYFDTHTKYNPVGLWFLAGLIWGEWA